MEMKKVQKNNLHAIKNVQTYIALNGQTAKVLNGSQ